VIHYHGTPLTPRDCLYKMAGKHFCVSFAHPSDAEICLQIGQSVMWDNGAFTAFTKGLHVNSHNFYQWLEPRLAHPHWAVIPDVIDGTVEQQKQKLKEWPYPVDFAAPVWHLGLPTDYLLELADNFPKICFGSSGEYWQVGSLKWEKRTDQAFNELAQKRKHLPWIHMLRGLAQAGKRWPFASADSVNVARNFKNGNGRCPEIMARKIDSIQTPVGWEYQKIDQMEIAYEIQQGRT